MITDKEKKMLKDRVLGKVKRVIKSSGMLELINGEKIPPFPNVEVGDTIEVKNGRYHVVGKGTVGSGSDKLDESLNDTEALKKENKALKSKQTKMENRLKALEAQFGEKGEKRQ